MHDEDNGPSTTPESNSPSSKEDDLGLAVSDDDAFLHETVTRLLHRWNDGEVQARDDLAVMVQQELRRLAQYQLARENGRFALQATALVNEAYLRLLKRNNVSFKNRGHFFGTFSQEMRRVLVDAFRLRITKKRQGLHVPLEEAIGSYDERPVDLVKLDDALRDLESFQGTAARVVEMRFFCGLTYDQIADLLDLTPKQVRRLWQQARHWLHQELSLDPSGEAENDS